MSWPFSHKIMSLNDKESPITLDVSVSLQIIPTTVFKDRAHTHARTYAHTQIECTHTVPLPYLPSPLLATVQNCNAMKSDSTFSNSSNSFTYSSTSYSCWIWLGWLCKTPAIWLPITSQSIKWSVKLTDAMTCQDCLLYMRSEKNGLHQSLDSMVYGFPFIQEKKGV